MCACISSGIKIFCSSLFTRVLSCCLKYRWMRKTKLSADDKIEHKDKLKECRVQSAKEHQHELAMVSERIIRIFFPSAGWENKFQ